MLRPYSAPPERVRVYTRWARISCPPQHATDRSPPQVIDLTTHCRRHTGGLSPALGVCVHPNQEVVMRKLFLTLVAGRFVAACGIQEAQSSRETSGER